MIAQESKKYLDPKNRTITTMFLLPLILDSKDILFKYYGFINAFIEDINRPWLDNHIFILYKVSSVSNTIQEEFKKNKWYYDTKNIIIDGEYYEEYIFVVKPELKEIVNNFKNYSYNILTTDDKIKILKFWNCFDFDHIYSLLSEDNEPKNLIEDRKEIIPEEDSLDEFNQSNADYFFKRIGF